MLITLIFFPYFRVCVPGEAFSSKFSSQPDCHIFPVANIGRNSAMKVLMKCHPRCGEIPIVPCHKHSQPNLSLKARKGQTVKEPSPESQAVGEYLYDGVLPGVSSRTSSPADSMLGESLLDPPNSLCMYPKRYQSPSRCGSPSIEVPEHLMFGKGNFKREECSPPRRSRPQRRPVVERFLKKNVVDDVGHSDTACRTFEKRIAAVKDVSKSDILAKKSDNVLSYCCIEEDLKQVPREEMEEVLERLRDRHAGLKCSHNNVHCLNDKSLHNKSISHLVDEMKHLNILEQNKECKKNIFCKGNDPKNIFKQALRLNKESSNNRRFERNVKSISPFEKLSSLPEVYNHRVQQFRGDSQNGHPKDQPTANHLLANKLNILQSSGYSPQSKNQSKFFFVPEQNTSETQSNVFSSEHLISKAYQQDRTLASQIHPRFGSVNIKKCGAFLAKNNIDELNDERDISESVSSISSNGSFCDDVSINL